jgi:hypothetical protein
VTIGGKDELNIKPFTFCITLCLSKAIAGMKVFPLCFDEGQGDGLCIEIDFDPENVVDLPSPSPPGLAVDYLDLSRRFFAPNEVFGPASLVDGRIDEFGSGIGFVIGHASTRIKDMAGIALEIWYVSLTLIK